jgi:predicted DNA-binding transcriptional regulator YafY
MELADLLRGRDTTTVAELAAELDVSRPTLLRDLASLRERGLPIAGDAGPGGGVRLEGDRGASGGSLESERDRGHLARSSAVSGLE